MITFSFGWISPAELEESVRAIPLRARPIPPLRTTKSVFLAPGDSPCGHSSRLGDNRSRGKPRLPDVPHRPVCSVVPDPVPSTPSPSFLPQLWRVGTEVYEPFSRNQPAAHIRRLATPLLQSWNTID